jgi:hypothetical protein
MLKWLTPALLLLAAAGCFAAGVVGQLAPLLAIAVTLALLAGMAAWRVVKPFKPR